MKTVFVQVFVVIFITLFLNNHPCLCMRTQTYACPGDKSSNMSMDSNIIVLGIEPSWSYVTDSDSYTDYQNPIL